MNREEIIELMFKVSEYFCDENLIQYLEDMISDIKYDRKGKLYGHPLLIAASENCIEVVKELIKRNVDVNYQNKYGTTALMSSHYIKVIILLIKAGADVNIQERHGYTALMFASRRGNKEIVQLLIDNGAEINIKDKTGNTALDLPLFHNRKEIIEILSKAYKEK